jgi:hypothetical protein
VNDNVRNTMGTVKYIALNIAIPLLSGGCIYFFRENSLTVFNFLEGTAAFEKIIQFKSMINFRLPEMILFNLSDGLWLYSFLSSVFIFIYSCKESFDAKWIFVPPGLAIAWELAQLLFPFLGTFDGMDLAFYFLACIIFVIFHPVKKIFENENTIKATTY